MNAYELHRLLTLIRKNLRVLSRSPDGMSITVGTDYRWSKYVQSANQLPIRSPFRRWHSPDPNPNSAPPSSR